jgi:hypothetical protein
MTNPIKTMKHSVALDVAQDHAKKLCVHNNIDWHHQTFHNYSFQNLPTDFRSKEGKRLKTLCSSVADVKQLKRFTNKLKLLVSQQQSNQGIFLQPNATLSDDDVAHASRCTSCPETVLNKIGYTVFSWWIRKCLSEKGCGVYLERHWKNEVDPISLSECRTLPPPFLYTYTDSRNHTYAFDIRTLYPMMQNKMHYNPFTKESLSEECVQHITTRAQHLTELGFNIQMEDDKTNATTTTTTKLSKRSIQQLVLTVCQALDYMGYHVTVEMLTQLRSKALLQWYASCEDIWNYRAQLTDQHKTNIVPQGNVFSYKETIKSYKTRLLPLQKIVFDTMLLLLTSGVSESEKQTGAIYVISALTESSTVFLESFQWLYQPP